MVSSVQQQTVIYRIKTEGSKIMVADYMKSLTIYDFNPDKDKDRNKVVCRDSRGQWCFDMLKLNDNHYLISDFHLNLSLLQ